MAIVRAQEITPEIAETWLSKTPDFQRKLDDRQVQKIMLAIQRNEWRENGATIVFNERGELIDGQHRLKAIALAGRSVTSLVVKEVSKEESTFQTIGDEKPRKVIDFIRCPQAACVGAVARIHWGVVNGIWPIGHGGVVAPTADVLKLLSKWQHVILPLVEPMRAPGRLVRQQAYCIFLVLYHTHLRPVEGAERIAEFFARVGDGLNLSATDPAYKLRQRFLKMDNTGDIKRTVAQAIILKALYLYLDGKPCPHLRFEPDREEFPALRGYRK